MVGLDKAANKHGVALPKSTSTTTGVLGQRLFVRMCDRSAIPNREGVQSLLSETIMDKDIKDTWAPLKRCRSMQVGCHLRAYASGGRGCLMRKASHNQPLASTKRRDKARYVKGLGNMNDTGEIAEAHQIKSEVVDD